MASKSAAEGTGLLFAFDRTSSSSSSRLFRFVTLFVSSPQARPRQLRLLPRARRLRVPSADGAAATGDSASILGLLRRRRRRSMPHASAALSISPISPISPISRRRRLGRFAGSIRRRVLIRRETASPRPAPPPPWRRAVPFERVVIRGRFFLLRFRIGSVGASLSSPCANGPLTRSPPPFSSPPSRQDGPGQRRPRSSVVRTAPWRRVARRQITRRPAAAAPPLHGDAQFPLQRVVRLRGFNALSFEGACRGSVAASRERFFGEAARGFPPRVREPPPATRAPGTAAAPRRGAASPERASARCLGVHHGDVGVRRLHGIVVGGTSSRVSSRRGPPKAPGREPQAHRGGSGRRSPGRRVLHAPDNPTSPPPRSPAPWRRAVPLKRVIRLRGFGRFWCDGGSGATGALSSAALGRGGRRVGPAGRRVGPAAGRPRPAAAPPPPLRRFPREPPPLLPRRPPPPLRRPPPPLAPARARTRPAPSPPSA